MLGAYQPVRQASLCRYVHHDLLLTSYPLCTAWLPKVAGSAKGSESFLAVGSTTPL